MKTNNNVVINRLTVMPILPNRMILNADNNPAAIGVAAVRVPTFTKQSAARGNFVARQAPQRIAIDALTER